MKYFIGKILYELTRIYWFFIRSYQKKKLESCGGNVYISKNCVFSKNVSIGEDVFIGSNARFISVHGKISIKNHIMFGPNVQIHGGNHLINKVGEYMIKNHDKKIGDDGEIIIEDDCWIGSNVIILKGVKIGEGSVVAAGSIVTKNIPPYSLFKNKKEDVILPRFSQEKLRRHKEIMKGEK